VPALVLLILLVIGVPAAESIAQTTLPPTVRVELRNSNIPESAYGAMVMEAGGRILLAHNDRLPMNPASVMKIITTHAALDLLGPAFSWRTEVLATGPLGEGRLDGDIILKGGGDPKLTMERFWMLLRDARARGIRDIAGDLVIDRSVFQVDDVDPGQFDGEPTRPYNAGPDALLINYRSARVTFIPDLQSRSIRIVTEPPVGSVRIVNELSAIDGACDEWPERGEVDLARGSLTFRGNFPLACGERVRHVLLPDPLDYVQALFRHLWEGLGGSFSGRARFGSSPADARPIASIESASLADIVRDINKNSNNVMARQLFLSLGLLREPPVTLDNSREALSAWLLQKGIAAQEIVVENGSGLSRKERVAPRTLARLLESAWFAPIGPELASSLPVAGVDGTLKLRFAGTAIAGRAHLKTGFLDNVRSIAGFLHGQQGRTLIVVSIINHPNARAATGVQDALLEWAGRTLTESTGCAGMQSASPHPCTRTRPP